MKIKILMKKNIPSDIRRVKRLLAKDKFSENEQNKAKFLIKYKTSRNDAIDFFQTLDNSLIQTYFGESLPNSYEKVNFLGNKQFIKDLNHELTWISLDFLKHADKINEFLIEHKHFQKNFLLSNFEICHKILEKINHNICYSKYTYINYLLLSRVTHDQILRNQLLEISKNLEKGFRLTANWIDQQFDINLSNQQFRSLLNDHLNRGHDLNYLNYLVATTIPFEKSEECNNEFHLYIESTYSVIDRYLCFLEICSKIISSESTSKYTKSHINELASIFAEKIHDRRIVNLASQSSENTSLIIEAKLSSQDFLRHFLDENYSLSYSTSLEHCLKNPENLQALDVLVKSLIKLNKSKGVSPFKRLSLLDIIYKSLIEIYTYSADYEISLNNLYHIITHNLFSEWTIFLYNIITSELKYNHATYHLPTLNFIYNGITLLKTPYFISKSISLPFHIQLVNHAYSINLKLNLATKFNSVILNFLLNNKFDLPLNADLNPIETINYKCFDEIALMFLKVHYTEYNLNYLSSIEISVSVLLMNSQSQNVIFHPNLLKHISNNLNADLCSSISTTIYVAFFSPNSNLLWISYDNFLCFNNIKTGSQLSNNLMISDAKLIYFLRYVCVTDIFDNSTYFSCVDDLEQERILILNKLIQINSQFKEVYFNEIKQIETKQLIRKGIKEIDESKIYVDTKSIYKSLQSEISQRFNRFKDLQNLSQSELKYLTENLNTAILIYINDTESNSKSIKFEYKTNDEVFSENPIFLHFLSTFLAIRDRFISSNEYGLDSYVSMRIRHGTLLGQVRSIYGKYNLLTKQDTKTKSYQPNEHWLSKIKPVNTKSKVIKHFNEFSENIDELSEYIKNNILQIRTEGKNNNGLFDYQFTDIELIQLTKEAFKTGSPDELYNLCVEKLWERTEINLSKIRSYFTEDYIMKSGLFVDNLMKNISDLKKVENINIDDLNTCLVRCKTDTSNEIDAIASWFKRSQSNSINNFTIRLVSQTALSVINKMHPTHPIKEDCLNIKSNENFIGIYFTHFIDIFFNIFNNISNKYEFANQDIDFNLTVTSNKEHLIIQSTNKIPLSIDIDKHALDVEKIQFQLNHEKGNTLLSKEGGTGYFKIKNTIKNHLNRNVFIIRIKIDKEKREFSSTIKFETIGLLIQ